MKPTEARAKLGQMVHAATGKVFAGADDNGFSDMSGLVALEAVDCALTMAEDKRAIADAAWTEWEEALKAVEAALAMVEALSNTAWNAENEAREAEEKAYKMID